VKRIGILLGLAGLILLDWAALHDVLIESRTCASSGRY
jgi:hypothetical protein